ncbi:MAG: AAA family ATPase, partial [Acidimicrobiales bacterium]
MTDTGVTRDSRNPKILLLGGDDALATQLATVAGRMRPRAEVVVCDQVGAVGDMLSDDGPFDVLVAGPSLGTKSGMARIEIIHDELPALPVMLAFGKRPEASLREVVRAGAVDLLQLPVSDDELHASLVRGLDLSEQLRAASLPAPVAAPVAAPASVQDGPGQVITVSSATGGCGKTFFATNLAYFLTRHTGKRACIIDLDLQFGEVSTGLRLKPKYTIFDALQRDDADEADLMAHVEEYLVVHETGIHVLAAPKEPSEADKIDPPDVTRIIEAIRSRFDYVIVDTPPALTEVVLAAFDLSSDLYVMATLDLPSVRNMGLFLSTLEKLRVPTDNVKLV